jgi:hypothetical protein
MEETARKGWLIYDLQRHPVPYYFITLMGKLTRLHPMVIHDGRISVARSLTGDVDRRQGSITTAWRMRQSGQCFGLRKRRELHGL